MTRDCYANWERFEWFVEQVASRLASDPDLRADVEQEMRLKMCELLAGEVKRSDSYIQAAMRNAALRFLGRVAFDGPHDSSGYRRSDLIDPLEE